jgi:hypothetical protein
MRQAVGGAVWMRTGPWIEGERLRLGVGGVLEGRDGVGEQDQDGGRSYRCGESLDRLLWCAGCTPRA